MTAGTTPNLGPRQRRRRLTSGAVGLVAAAVIGGILAVAEASLIARTLVFVPLYAAGLGFFQHREKT
ncbi:MAG TPA: hypothetical protein VFZ24_05420 [Longimicrobiales bacterium]